MNKKAIGLISFFLFSDNMFAINIKVSYYDSIELTDTKLKYRGFETSDEEYDIKWEIINNISYINFNYTGNFLSYTLSGIIVPQGQKRYLVLYNDGEYILFYDENHELVFSKYSNYSEDDNFIQATSELIENNFIYKVENVLDIKTLIPWVEGVQGNGVGQKIKITLDDKNMSTGSGDRFIYFGLAISNGFVDYNRPYLYQYNNRIKKLRVSRTQYDYKDIDLEDTPQIQMFHFLDYTTASKSIEMEILEIYPGERWDDTCINMIIPLGNFVF
jgi:hypothetical protein